MHAEHPAQEPLLRVLEHLHLVERALQVLCPKGPNRCVVQLPLDSLDEGGADVVCRVQQVVGGLGDVVTVLGEPGTRAVQEPEQVPFGLPGSTLAFAGEPEATDHVLELRLVLGIALDAESLRPVDPGDGVEDLFGDARIGPAHGGKEALPCADDGLDPGDGHRPSTKEVEARADSPRRGGSSLGLTDNPCPCTEPRQSRVEDRAGSHARHAVTSLVPQAAKRLFAARESGVRLGLERAEDIEGVGQCGPTVRGDDGFERPCGNGGRANQACAAGQCGFAKIRRAEGFGRAEEPRGGRDNLGAPRHRRGSTEPADNRQEA